MRPSAQDLQKILRALRNLDVECSCQPVHEFVGTTLGLDELEWASLAPEPDPDGVEARLVAHLTHFHEQLILKSGAVPNFAVYQDAIDDHWYVEGIVSHLRRGAEAGAVFPDRVSEHLRVREYLRRRTGHELEAIGAALLSRIYDAAWATRGAADQGVDAVSTQELLSAPADAVAAWNLVRGLRMIPSENTQLFVVASMKANESGTRATRSTLQPTHIRDLIGTLLLQRSEAGVWKRLGIRALSPALPVLVTTYVLSTASWLLCSRAGVQVWALPELVILTCRLAPNAVFPGGKFSGRAFRKWWSTWADNRIAPDTELRTALGILA